MRCPGLSALPLPQPGQTGWPWTEGSPPLPDASSNGSPWPRVSVVTPSFNQGAFLEETIRSVLLQGYPDLELIIIDGGSADDSVSTIRKYERWLTYWTSENDRGQSHALNKGFAKATGEVFSWVNSDDLLAPGAIACALELLSSRRANWVTGAAYVGNSWNDPAKNLLKKTPSPAELKRGRTYLQPSSYFRQELYAKVGGVDESLHFVMDYDLWCRFAEAGEWPVLTDRPLSLAREHSLMKTQPANYHRSWPERRLVLRRNLGFVGFWLWMLRGGCRRLPILRRLIPA